MEWISAQDRTQCPEYHEVVLVQIKGIMTPLPEFTTAVYNKAAYVYQRTDKLPLKGQVVAWLRIIPYNSK